MNTVTQFSDEAPTKPSEFVPSKMLVFAGRVDRLVAEALDRIRSGDPAAAALTLVQLQAVTGGVSR